MRLSMGHWHRAVLILSISSAACGGPDHPNPAALKANGGSPSGGTTPNGGAASESTAGGNGGTSASGGVTNNSGGAAAASSGSLPSGIDLQGPVDTQDYAALKARADAASSLDANGVAATYATSFAALDYDPTKAEFLDRIQQSALALSDGEQAALGKNGFVISTAREFPTFVNGYAEIYSEHLPVYVSADAVLESVHSSYDTLLMEMEQSTLIDDVTALLRDMRTRLPASSASSSVRADLDVYLAVAQSLMQGSVVDPVAGGDASTIASLVSQATDATGIGNIELFGDTRMEDFSEFAPRGHYTGASDLSQYFRAMIWLGRVDFRLVETNPDGSQTFHREQYEAMLAVRDLVGPSLDRWQQVDDVLSTFVGKSDNMVVPQIDQLVADLGGESAALAASDDAVNAALVKGGYGQQNIASYLMLNDGTTKTLPLNRSFLIFGQRYIVDSDVFSAVVYDRVQGRLMPNPLDAAFAALGNDQAYALDPDVATVRELPGALARVRALIDANGPSFWQSSFYNLWLASLRALSPTSDPASATGLPKVARTEPWGRRLLDTQLGSWAELRHDTLLYAKQSYTGIPGCDFPDAYVDPYPEFFASIRAYAEQGARITALVPTTYGTLAQNMSTYFDTLRSAADVLAQIATAERKGDALTMDQLAFINDAVRIENQSVGCTSILVPDGWLAKLFFDPQKSIVFDPTIADVHTQAADEGGNIVGKILHIGTGYPRLMVATVDSCGGGPRAYAGVVFAYHEQITTNFDRLTDERWAQQFGSGGTRPADVPWLLPVLAH
ncbi:MAG TPA: DUF3160 domain-containing protein [Polyangiaceae bacterium]|nr:DUF3160 domain-containing protein [Polyangiaceae bacterium]